MGVGFEAWAIPERFVVAPADAPAREARNCTLGRGESRVAMR